MPEAVRSTANELLARITAKSAASKQADARPFERTLTLTFTDTSQLRTWLNGTDYPADKSALIHQAEQNGAPNDVLSALREMPPATYTNRAEVAASIRVSNQQTDTEKAGERRRHSHSGRTETEAETPTNPIAEVRGDNPKRSDRE